MLVHMFCAVKIRDITKRHLGNSNWFNVISHDRKSLSVANKKRYSC